jgi:hypothetical protein
LLHAKDENRDGVLGRVLLVSDVTSQLTRGRERLQRSKSTFARSLVTINENRHQRPVTRGLTPFLHNARKSATRAPPTSRRTHRHAPDPCRVAHRATGNGDRRWKTAWSPKTFSLRLGALETFLDPFSDAGPFELRDRARNMHLQLAGGRGGSMSSPRDSNAMPVA